MNIKTFIDRPIFAGVISVVIVLLGAICLVGLPVEQFPQIAPPTVSVSANYSGANAETVQRSVVIPLEEAINGVENMMYMTSSATNNGGASIQIYFRQGTNPDMAMVNVQNRIASAQGLLPAEVTRSGVSVRKRQTSRIKTLAVYSPDDSFDERFISNYLKINIEPRLSRIAGVGEVDVRGADYSLRIWLDPTKMAKYALMPSDISAVLAEQNLEAPTGTLGADSKNTFRYTLKYRGRYEKEEDYANMVIRAEADGTVLRLKDVARVELGSNSYDYIGKVNGHAGTTLMISQTSGSNANEIIEAIDKEVEEIRKTLPKGIEIVDLMSTKDFLDASIASVIETLILAIILVVLVVYIFLQSFRSTFIPALAIIVSLIGTFAFLQVAGFSLNMITLFALVLVIGTVVDNAIVVVEAVQAKLDEGYRSPYLATVDAMKGISSALVATTIVFMAVFIPVTFMGGTTGTFYTQFGLTMAVAVGISLLNSLTLSPALCALLMKPHIVGKDGKLPFSARFHIAFDAGFKGLVNRYKKGAFFMLKHRWLAWILVVAATGGLFYMMATTKTGLVPKEDMGSINVDVQTPPGTNLGETVAVMEEIASRLDQIPQIEAYSYTTGYGMMSGVGSSCGMMSIRLIPWEERTGEGDDIDSVIDQIYEKTSDITSAKILAFTRGMIPGYGASGGFELYIQDQKGGSIEDLKTITDNLIAGLNERPEIGRASTAFDTKYPQYLLEVDAARCKRNGVSPSNVLSVVAGYVGGSYASNMNRFSKLYRVMFQASPEYRLDTDAFNNMFVRNSKGEMSPVGQYVKLTRIYGAQSLSRFNLFSAISVNGQAANGYSSGEAIQAVREVAAETLPAGYGYEFGGMSREEAAGGSSTAIIFVICVVFIYLILCALYESLFIPIVVILSVPFGLAGSFLFANMFGLENNIYLQIGLLMLIGLLAKTAILLTEYASARRAEGMSIVMAALSAAKARLRAILMTSLTMIFGMLPMMFATGVGANGNISIGVGTVGGMLIGTLALLFVVPALFVVFQSIEERVMPKRVKPAEAEDAVAQIEE
ncbi:MAG: efflux RND transporter permease subunit [Rikenellaceae bacterium]|nr:efflux RND transporter permease subunit [Rikenellaceae bacterium]